MDSVRVVARIEVKGNVIYERSRILALDSAQQTLVLLDSNLRYPEIADAKAYFWLSHDLDAVKTNDTTSFSFIFSDKASIESLESIGLSVRPNPFSGAFILQSTHPMDRIIARDVAGRMVELVKPNSLSYRWETDWKPGVYWLEVWSGTSAYSLRVIKVP